ncbi:MAG: hypothetical protein MRY21_04010 [Simkaniaceae bacterium]|nr:hypothetical protein [Simkaniaceae bacterium]
MKRFGMILAAASAIVCGSAGELDATPEVTVKEMQVSDFDREYGFFALKGGMLQFEPSIGASYRAQFGNFGFDTGVNYGLYNVFEPKYSVSLQGIVFSNPLGGGQHNELYFAAGPELVFNQRANSMMPRSWANAVLSVGKKTGKNSYIQLDAHVPVGAGEHTKAMFWPSLTYCVGF